MKKDIESLDDVRLLVDAFYAKVRQDDLLGGIFGGIIGDRWPQHLEKMYSFWQTLLLEEHTYFGSPFRPHATLPVGAEHFKRWMQLFTQTLDEHFAGVRAEQARWRAGKMAEMFLYKIDYLQQHHLRPLV